MIVYVLLRVKNYNKRIVDIFSKNSDAQIAKYECEKYLENNKFKYIIEEYVVFE